MTIETKIAKNGAINFYDAETGKRIKEADAVAYAIENGGTFFSASVHGYDVDNFVTKEFISPITAYKWIRRMANKSTTYADGDHQIVEGFHGETIYMQTYAVDEIKNSELKAYVEAEEAPRRAEEARQEREVQIAAQMQARNITREQAEQLVDYLRANRTNYNTAVANTVKDMVANFQKINAGETDDNNAEVTTDNNVNAATNDDEIKAIEAIYNTAVANSDYALQKDCIEAAIKIVAATNVDKECELATVETCTALVPVDFYLKNEIKFVPNAETSEGDSNGETGNRVAELQAEYDEINEKMKDDAISDSRWEHLRKQRAVVRRELEAAKTKTVGHNVETVNELPADIITVSSGAEAWAIVANYFPYGVNFARNVKGFNNEDTFSYTSDGILYASATCTPDNSRVECLEVVNTNTSGSKRKLLTVYIAPTGNTEPVNLPLSRQDREIELLALVDARNNATDEDERAALNESIAALRNELVNEIMNNALPASDETKTATYLPTPIEVKMAANGVKRYYRRQNGKTLRIGFCDAIELERNNIIETCKSLVANTVNDMGDALACLNLEITNFICGSVEKSFLFTNVDDAVNSARKIRDTFGDKFISAYIVGDATHFSNQTLVTFSGDTEEFSNAYVDWKNTTAPTTKSDLDIPNALTSAFSNAEDKNTDDFTLVVERLKANYDTALAEWCKVDFAERGRKRKSHAVKNALAKVNAAEKAIKDFSDAFLTNLSPMLDKSVRAAQINIVNQDGFDWGTLSLADISLDYDCTGTNFTLCADGYFLADYRTPAQTETVIRRLKAAISNGDTEFTFPALDELINPIHADSLAAVSETCATVNARAPEGWEVYFDSDAKAFIVDYCGKNVTTLRNLNSARNSPPEDFFYQFMDFDNDCKPACFDDEPHESATFFKPRDAVDFDDNGNITAIWF